jgi:hypothetical protein
VLLPQSHSVDKETAMPQRLEARRLKWNKPLWILLNKTKNKKKEEENQLEQDREGDWSEKEVLQLRLDNVVDESGEMLGEEVRVEGIL